MRVLLLNTSFRLEGPNRTFHELGKRAKRLGIELFAGALAGRGPMEEIYKELGVPTVYFGRPGLGALSVVGKLSRFLKDERIDLVNCQLLRGEVVGALSTVAARSTVFVCTVQNEDPYRRIRYNPVKALLSRWALRQAKKVIVVSRALKGFVTEYQGIPSSRIQVIPNSVDPSCYMTSGATSMPDDLSRGVKYIGCVGRLDEQKGHEFLIEAYHRFVDCREGRELLLIGSGPKRKSLEVLAASGPGASSIRFIGWSSVVASYFPFFDVYVQPSLWEGMPFATMEAMASGVPVVASRVGGLPELVEDGKEGFLVQSGDPKSLGRRIEQLLSDSALSETMARAARRKIHGQFSADKMANTYVTMYDSIVKAVKDGD